MVASARRAVGEGRHAGVHAREAVDAGTVAPLVAVIPLATIREIGPLSPGNGPEVSAPPSAAQ